MIRTIAISWILAFLATLAQSTWLHHLAIMGVVPDIALLVILWVSCSNNKAEGPVTGFLTGLSGDFLRAAPLGFGAFVYTAAAWAASLLYGTVRVDGIILPVLVGALGTVAKMLSAALLAIVFGTAKISAPGLFGLAVWVEVALNAALAPLIFLGLKLLRRFFVTGERRR